MIFERHEIEEILKTVQNNSVLHIKIQRVLNSTKEGRFTIHCTEKNKYKGDIIGDLLIQEEVDVR